MLILKRVTSTCVKFRIFTISSSENIKYLRARNFESLGMFLVKSPNHGAR